MSYRESVYSTLNPALDPTARLTNAALGLCGEAGEAAELVKKHLFHGQVLDRDKLLLELGDVAFYFELLMAEAGFTRAEVESANMAKRKARYPKGFKP